MRRAGRMTWIAVTVAIIIGFLAPADGAVAQTEQEVLEEILELKATEPENDATRALEIELAGDVVDVGQVPGGGPVPPNDTCQTAIAASCGALQDSNIGSGSSGEVSCGLADDQSSVWYLFTSPGSGNLTLSTCSALTDYDTELALYGGPCPGVNCIVGADDDPGCGFNGLHSTITGPVTQGTDYWIMVDGFAGLQGDFELDIDCSELDIPVPATPPWGLALLVLALLAGGLLVLRRGLVARG